MVLGFFHVFFTFLSTPKFCLHTTERRSVLLIAFPTFADMHMHNQTVKIKHENQPKRGGGGAGWFAGGLMHEEYE